MLYVWIPKLTAAAKMSTITDTSKFHIFTPLAAGKQDLQASLSHKTCNKTSKLLCHTKLAATGDCLCTLTRQ